MNTQKNISRNFAYQLLIEYTTSESLIRHAFAVEGIMRYFAGLYGEDANEWGIIGLIHDIDYECHPDQHCTKAKEILKNAGFPSHYIRAVMSHGWGQFSDVKPESQLEKVLYAVDELAGLIYSVARIRPSGSLNDLKVKSVTKKIKDKSFAASIDRKVIKAGAEMLGIEMSELIKETIAGMKTVSKEIGLTG